jgi:hypothetical protein
VATGLDSKLLDRLAKSLVVGAPCVRLFAVCNPSSVAWGASGASEAVWPEGDMSKTSMAGAWAGEFNMRALPQLPRAPAQHLLGCRKRWGAPTTGHGWRVSGAGAGAGAVQRSVELDAAIRVRHARFVGV